MDIFLLVVLIGAMSAVKAFWTAGAVAVAALLVAGSLGFWFLLALASLGVLLSLEFDHEASAFLSVLAAAVALQFFSGVDIVGFLRANPRSILILAASYMVLGTCWSFFKWFLFVRDKRKEYDEQVARWKSERRKENGREFFTKPTVSVPKAKENKSRIVGWMTFWPWSALWFLINDPVRRAFRAVFDYFHGAYQRIADKAFEGAKLEDDAP